MAQQRKGNMFAAFDEEEEGAPVVKQQTQPKKQAQPKKEGDKPKTARQDDRPSKFTRPSGGDDEGFNQVQNTERVTTNRGGRGRGGPRPEGRGGYGGRGRAYDREGGDAVEGGRGRGRAYDREGGDVEGGRGGRGSRGGRGRAYDREGGNNDFEGGRGGRGYRGDREEGGRGRGRGGFGRGRGRGYNQRINEDGAEVVTGDQQKEDIHHESHSMRYQGKTSEKWHPYDRHSGTGRSKNPPKGGHGRGNWGKAEDQILGEEGAATEQEVSTLEGATTAEAKEIVEGEVVEGEEAKGEAAPYKKEYQKEESEEEETGLTLEDYLASKKTSTIKKEARKPEELKKANIEKFTDQKQKQETITSQIKNQETYNVATGQSKQNNLLGFQAPPEEFEQSSRGGRGRGSRGDFQGGRGRGRAGNTGAGTGYSGKRQGGRQTLNVNEESYPTL